MTCFSFDPVKVITSIDGGAVVVGDAAALERLRHWRFLGIDRETLARYKNSRAWEYDVVSQGFRYHLTNINAAVGLSQLTRVDEFIASRRQACRLYNRRLAGIAGVRCPATDFEDVSPFIYTVRVPAARRERLIEHLRGRGIATGIHFLPAQDFTYFKTCRRGDLSVTERVTREIMTLPLHTHMPRRHRRAGRRRDPRASGCRLMDAGAAIGRFTVTADWDAERPLPDAALTAYATHGCLLLRGFAAPDLLARFRDEVATILGLVLRERGLDPAGSALDAVRSRAGSAPQRRPRARGPDLPGRA